MKVKVSSTKRSESHQVNLAKSHWRFLYAREAAVAGVIRLTIGRSPAILFESSICSGRLEILEKTPAKVLQPADHPDRDSIAFHDVAGSRPALTSSLTSKRCTRIQSV